MTENELFKILKKIGIPVAYREFSKDTQPPFAVYFRKDNDVTFADDIAYHSAENIQLELYTPKVRNLSLEKKVETLLTENEIAYSVSDEIYLKDENMVEIIYEFFI